jgi:gas vesicle protein
MLHNRKDKNVWFMAGLGLGALAGVLLAPKSGRETRKAIASGVNEGVQHLAALAHDTRERVKNMMDFAKKSLARKRQQAGAAMYAAKKVLGKAA